MRAVVHLLIVSLTLAAAACGKSEEPAPAPPAKPAEPAAKPPSVKDNLTPKPMPPPAPAPAPPPASQASSQPASQPAVQMRHGIFFYEPGAPDPLACGVDRDCVANTILDKSGCCIASPTPVAHTKGYAAWIVKKRATDACKAVECPPLPIPSEPAKCTFEVHCVANRCKNSCSE